MNPARWQQIKDLFGEAIERAPEDRDAYVAQACAADVETQTVLRGLLHEHEACGGLLDESPVLPPDAAFPHAALFYTFRPGEVVAQRFRVISFRGRGGMGEVYEAYDTKLQERVALKTIRLEIASDPRVVENFKREVSRARKVASPYVCRAYDLFTYRLVTGQEVLFLTMELLEGESLSDRLQKRGRMTAEEALPLVRQMGEGLAAAHAAGIIHHDFKSSNVMLVPVEDGSQRAVITDFGLARHIPPQFDTSKTTGVMTLEAGTPAYMAPEQLEGGQANSATDLYSLGVVIYELITGRLPFQGNTLMETAVKRLKEKPAPPRALVPDLPPHLESVILRCLERDPRDRFSSATDLVRSLSGGAKSEQGRKIWPALRWGLASAVLFVGLAELFWFGRRGEPPWQAPPNSVAVLPFENVGGPPGSDYYSDGVTEELIHALTNIRGLQVIARESSFRFRGNTAPLRAVARQLGVRAILTGSIRRDGEQMRIIVRLVNAWDGTQLWSTALERPETEVFAVQNQIALAAAGALLVRQVQAPDSGRAPPSNMKAHELQLIGRFHLNKVSDEGLMKARESFERAIAIDPDYAVAHAGLADAFTSMAERDLIPAADALARAKSAALRAVTLEPRLADGYVSLAQVTSLYDRDYGHSERHFLKALELNPNLVSALQWYSYMLLKLRRFEESVRYARRALNVDPLSNRANGNLAVIFFYMRDHERLLEQCQKMLELDPGHWLPRLLTTHLLARQGRADDAYRELDAITSLPKEHRLILRTRAEISAILGRHNEAELALNALLLRKPVGRIPSSHIAIAYASLGQADDAFFWLERAYAEYDAFLSLLDVYPAFDSLRGDPRYASLLTRLGIKEKMVLGSIRIP